jgi:transcriptional regulator with XRE-family HTH domain
MSAAQHFAGRLKELRERAGLTQAGLAEKAGMKVGGIRDLEQGINSPRWETVVDLAAALGVDCRAFLEAPAAAPEPKRGRPPKPPGPEPTPEKAKRARKQKK